MANVTYLLGAGASYNALPVVDEIPNAIHSMIYELERIHDGSIAISSDAIDIADKYRNYLKKAIQDLEILLNGCNDHLSIDTFAKMLFLTRNERYDKVKNTISLFFELFPYIQNEIRKTFAVANTLSHSRRYDILDKRYDAFLASILQDYFDQLPKNVRVVTYNYDHQLKAAYRKYVQNANRESSLEYLLNCYSRNENVRLYSTNEFSIYKINGSSGFYNPQKALLHLDAEKSQLGPIFDCISKYYYCAYDRNDHQSAVSFAWESNPEDDSFIGNIRRATILTDVLVVIGYSFPFFNRKIDDCIFRRDSMHQLKKIYVQDKNADEIIERIRAIRPYGVEPELKYIPIYNTHQFYLPPELSL